MSVYLDAQVHRELQRWTLDAAESIGAQRVSFNELVVVLLDQVRTDAKLSEKVLADIQRRREAGRTSN